MKARLVTRCGCTRFLHIDYQMEFIRIPLRTEPKVVEWEEGTVPVDNFEYRIFELVAALPGELYYREVGCTQ